MTCRSSRKRHKNRYVNSNEVLFDVSHWLFVLQVSALEAQISSLTSDNGALQLELSTTCHDLTEVRGDAAKYAESASETMSNYQRELAQHGKTMDELLTIKDQVSLVATCTEHDVPMVIHVMCTVIHLLLVLYVCYNYVLCTICLKVLLASNSAVIYPIMY